MIRKKKNNGKVEGQKRYGCIHILGRILKIFDFTRGRKIIGWRVEKKGRRF